MHPYILLSNHPNNKFGGLFDEVLHAAQLGLGFIGSQQHGGGNGSGQQTGPCRPNMRDQGRIAGCIDSLSSQYHQAEQALGWTLANGHGADQLLQLAQAIMAQLNDSATFANQGDVYLDLAKGTLAHTISILQGQLGSGGGGSGGGTGGTGTGGTSSIITGISDTTVLIGGAVALIGVVYLIKR